MSRRYAYVTRLNTVISPEEMTVDPVFDYDPQLKDVSNVRDLSDMEGVFQCDRLESQSAPASVSAESPVVSSGQNGGTQDTTEAARSSEAATESKESSLSVGTLAVGIVIGAAGVLLTAALVYLGVVMRRRSLP